MSDMIVLSKETKAIFPFIKDKALIDMINGLDVAKELNHVQQHRLDLRSRILDSMSGATTMRQANINDHVLASIEASRELFKELSKDIEHHAVALITLESSIQNLERKTATIAHYVADFKGEFQAFASETQKQITEIKHELDKNKRMALAEQQMSRLMDKWQAGGLNQLSPMGRCYAVLDALYWGAFGNTVRLDGDQEQFVENLRDKMIVRLKTDLGIEAEQDLIRDEWLRLPENTDKDLQKVLAFQGDWSVAQPKDFPTTFTATQWNMLPSPLRVEHQDVLFSMMDIKRVTKRLIRDRFEG